MRFAGVSKQIKLPWPSTRMRSEFMTKRSRWAIASTVESLVCFVTTSKSWSADSRSMEAVHSSKIKTLGLRTSARAAISNCCCPMERAFALRGAASASDNDSIPVRACGERQHRSRAMSTSASVNSSPTFSLRLIFRIVGSCGTTATLLRRSDNFSVATSIPSSNSRPPLLGATPFSGPKRSNKLTSVDFPLPVFPTTPSFSAGRTWRLTSCNAAKA
mmetsp:Transcript_105886/g.236206  ORF Transcript_105886/g.236206 Transcript_105886/m.236206 type:complete len:217 (+) Transcript_105886:312-962(+)